MKFGPAQAGSGGFDINVKGNTDLKGAYIASDADASKNTLTTGTLTWSDIQNHSNYNASSSGITIGGGGVGIAPMISQSESNNEQATTKSGVSSGAIVITDAGNQKQDVATLNRDTTDLNGTVSKLPDVNDLISQQQDVMNAANAAGTQIAQAIGTYSDYKENQAKSGAKAATLLGETDEAAAYNSEAATWGEGGSGRVILHVAGGAVLGGLGAGGVGGAVGGAAGAGVSSAMAGHLNDLADAAGAPGTIEHAAGNALANLLATAAGAAVGGSAGAFTAANADLNNRQLHPDEKTWIKENAEKYAKQQGISVDQAVADLTAQANRQVQNGSPGAWNASASAFLDQAHGMLPADGNSGPGYMFYATPEQKANVNMYANYYPNGVGLNQPSAQQIQNSVAHEQSSRDLMAGGTVAAATAGIATVGAPIAATVGATAAATIGGTVSGGMDAAGQLAQTGEIRPPRLPLLLRSGQSRARSALVRNSLKMF
ncbi:hypothetical protein [Paraburkholderia rhizosphaerae]|uniref:Hemagglutinin-like protein n=1 Tax=Paraburkholderia rhizosphaerae TaxID=480658 RepID=A0A4R8L3C7_9BURK|nr:hypothetical protein [Paraburkholderia rhizosphaerae]TDY37046.1 hypothetical protein BX592_1465 [Paraburkholderia rhizosphaerae]